MTNIDSILKNRDFFLPTKVRLVKAMVFLVVMYGCDSWTVKKAEHRRIFSLMLFTEAFFHQCFFTVVLEKTLESSLNCEEIKPVNPKGSQS